MRAMVISLVYEYDDDRIWMRVHPSHVELSCQDSSQKPYLGSLCSCWLVVQPCNQSPAAYAPLHIVGPRCVSMQGEPNGGDDYIVHRRTTFTKKQQIPFPDPGERRKVQKKKAGSPDPVSLLCFVVIWSSRGWGNGLAAHLQ